MNYGVMARSATEGCVHLGIMNYGVMARSATEGCVHPGISINIILITGI